MRTNLLVTLLFSFLTMIACENKSNTNTQAGNNTDTNTEVAVTDNNDEPTANTAVEENTITIPTFSIKFDRSPEVKELLEEKGEKMIVDISIMGEPIDATAVQAKDYFNEEEQKVYLLQQGIPYSNQAVMTIENLTAEKEALEALTDQNYEVVIMLYTDRKTADKNLIDAPTFIMPINQLKGTTQTIKVEML